MITLYGRQGSGNCYKPRLLLALLGRPFRHVEVSMHGGTTRPEFLALNPKGQVPLLALEDGRILSESDAILCWLGEGSAFVPADPFDRARMLQWMFFEQNGHEIYVAVRRALLIYPERKALATPERLAELLRRGEVALALMEGQLAQTRFLLGDAPSLADIALYAYTHCAEQGGFALTPALRRWIAAIETLPGYRPMTWLPDPSGS